MSFELSANSYLRPCEALKASNTKINSSGYVQTLSDKVTETVLRCCRAYMICTRVRSMSRRCYIRFIRNVNEKKGVEGQEETRKAYDFMLSYVEAGTQNAFGSRSRHCIGACMDGLHYVFKIHAGSNHTRRVAKNDCYQESISESYCYSCPSC